MEHVLALALTVLVDAPSSLAAAAERVRSIDRVALAEALDHADLTLPAEVRVALVADDDPLARAAPPWIIGRAFGTRDVVIFPARVSRYPYDSLDAVMRHEVVHLALTAQAGGRPLPRWFHEGVATSVESGWDAADRLHLLFAALGEPTIADLGGLFQSDAQPDTALAYLLAAALVNDLRSRHGATLPGRIARRVAAGAAFPAAFAAETGETPDAAAARAWRVYRQWTAWVPAVVSASSLWTLIVLLAVAAFVVRRRRRALRRRLWDEDERDPW